MLKNDMQNWTWDREPPHETRFFLWRLRKPDFHYLLNIQKSTKLFYLKNFYFCWHNPFYFSKYCSTVLNCLSVTIYYIQTSMFSNVSLKNRKKFVLTLSMAEIFDHCCTFNFEARHRSSFFWVDDRFHVTHVMEFKFTHD